MDLITDRRRHHYSTASSVEGSMQLSPILALPSISRPIDTPLTSPAFSETSSIPSMVSDDNTVSSASPRTNSSNMRHKYGDLRRPSALCVDSPDDVYFTTGYQGSKAVDSVSNFASKPRFLPDLPTWRQHTALLTQSWIMPPEKTRTQLLKIGTPEHDSRLSVNNLLN